jgi:hypothetical protein
MRNMTSQQMMLRHLLDNISSDPSWRTKSRYAPAKGKGKARGKTSNNGRVKKNASNPFWDSTCTVIPKFGAQSGIILFAIGDLMAPHLIYAVKHTRQFEKTNLNPGQRIKMIDVSEVRLRIKQGQFPDQNLEQVYYKALDAMYSVNMSIDNYLVCDRRKYETNRKPSQECRIPHTIWPLLNVHVVIK